MLKDFFNQLILITAISMLITVLVAILKYNNEVADFLSKQIF